VKYTLPSAFAKVTLAARRVGAAGATGAETRVGVPRSAVAAGALADAAVAVSTSVLGTAAARRAGVQ